MTTNLIIEANDQIISAFNANNKNMTRIDIVYNGIGYDIYYKCNINGWIYIK
jgi:hypothetical protein